MEILRNLSKIISQHKLCKMLNVNVMETSKTSQSLFQLVFFKKIIFLLEQ